MKTFPITLDRFTDLLDARMRWELGQLFVATRRFPNDAELALKTLLAPIVANSAQRLLPDPLRDLHCVATLSCTHPPREAPRPAYAPLDPDIQMNVQVSVPAPSFHEALEAFTRFHFLESHQIKLYGGPIESEDPRLLGFFEVALPRLNLREERYDSVSFQAMEPATPVRQRYFNELYARALRLGPNAPAVIQRRCVNYSLYAQRTNRRMQVYGVPEGGISRLPVSALHFLDAHLRFHEQRKPAHGAAC